MNNETSSTSNMLKDQVRHIANQITNGIELTEDDQHILDETGQEPGDMMYVTDYLSDALDIQYVVSSSKEYLGARILVAFGGPNIWIDTQNSVVDGYWWGDSAHDSFVDNMGLDEYMEELYNCL